MSFPDGEDYYAILGAANTVSHDEIERLYKRLARQHHPDRGGDAERMKAINEAYRVLGNEDLRRLYDLQMPESVEPLRRVVPPLSPPSTLLPDNVNGRLMGALLFLLGGTDVSFLSQNLLHQIHVANLTSGCDRGYPWRAETPCSDGVCTGESCTITFLRHYVWAQELAFWFMVCGGAYGIYLLLRSI